MTATYEAATGPEVTAGLAALAATGKVPTGFAYNPDWNPQIRRRVGGTFADDMTSVLEVSAHTTDATPTEMLDANGDRLVLPNNATWGFQVLGAARRTDVDGEGAAYNLFGCIERNANAAATSLVSTVQGGTPIEDTAGWDMAATADATNGALKLTVTGTAAKVVDWYARVVIVQVGG